jgi:hypothetical protein
VSRERSTISISYLLFSFQRSSPLFKFEKAFETLIKNNKDYKKTLRMFNLRKPKRDASMSEHVGPIFDL